LSIFAKAQALRRGRALRHARCSLTTTTADRRGADVDTPAPNGLVREIAHGRWAAPRLRDGGLSVETTRELKGVVQEVRWLLTNPAGEGTGPIGRGPATRGRVAETRELRRDARRAFESAARTSRTLGRTARSHKERLGRAAIGAREGRCVEGPLLRERVLPTARGFVRARKARRAIRVRAVYSSIAVVVRAVEAVLRPRGSAALPGGLPTLPRATLPRAALPGGLSSLPRATLRGATLPRGLSSRTTGAAGSGGGRRAGARARAARLRAAALEDAACVASTATRDEPDDAGGEQAIRKRATKRRPLRHGNSDVRGRGKGNE